MVLNVGIVSACVLYKNRPGAMTRLQKLQKRLKQKPISQKILYSHPIKKIFSICLILTFMLGFILFLHQYKQQIVQKHGNLQRIQQQQYHYLFPYRPTLILQNQLPHSIENQHRHSINFISVQAHNQYEKVQTTVFCILMFFLIPLLILVASLKFQRVIIKSKNSNDSNQISGYIQKQQLTLLEGWINKHNYLCKLNDILFIQLCGDNRFTNTAYYYAIKKITKQQSENIPTNTNNNQNVQNPPTSQLNQQIILTKGNIYQTRQTIIYMCHILKKQQNLSIKNGPIKKNKTKNNQKKKQKTI